MKARVHLIAIVTFVLAFAAMARAQSGTTVAAILAAQNVSVDTLLGAPAPWASSFLAGVRMDSVMSEWVVSGEVVGPCESTNTQTVTTTYTRTMVLPPVNGGSVLPTTQTYVSSQSCPYVPPPTSDWPATPADIRPIGDNYTDSRRFIEAQGHHRLDGGSLDVHSGIIHTHLGANLPVAWKGIVPIDWRVFALHAEGARLVQVLGSIQGATGAKALWQEPYKRGKPGLINKIVDQHQFVYTLSSVFDVSAVPDGIYYMEITADFVYPDRREEKTRMKTSFYVGNHSEPPPNWRPVVGAEWKLEEIEIDPVTGARIELGTSGGYPGIEIRNAQPFDDSPLLPMSVVTIPPSGAAQTHPMSARVFLNPDLHADPPNFGTELLAETLALVRSTPYPVFVSSLPAGTRVVARGSDITGAGTNPLFRGAVLAVATVGKRR